MSSSFVTFEPSTAAAFSFQLTLNGVSYVATIPWNIFGERYYLSLADLSGNVVLYRPLTSSGPRIQASLNWANNSALVTAASPHNVPVGTVAKVRISQTGTAFDGQYQALATSHHSMTYPMQVNPNVPTPQSGTMSFDLNLVEGAVDASGNAIDGWLLYHYDTSQFEFEASSTG